MCEELVDGGRPNKTTCFNWYKRTCFTGTTVPVERGSGRGFGGVCVCVCVCACVRAWRENERVVAGWRGNFALLLLYYYYFTAAPAARGSGSGFGRGREGLVKQ